MQLRSNRRREVRRRLTKLIVETLSRLVASLCRSDSDRLTLLSEIEL